MPPLEGANFTGVYDCNDQFVQDIQNAGLNGYTIYYDCNNSNTTTSTTTPDPCPFIDGWNCSGAPGFETCGPVFGCSQYGSLESCEANCPPFVTTDEPIEEGDQ